MSLKVKFYNNTDPVFCANKTLNDSTDLLVPEIEGVPVEAEILLYPSFLVDYNENLLSCNYAYIADWGNRYYFCQVTTENGGNIRIDCAVDALTTYWKKEEIQNTPMTIVRSTSFEKPTYVGDGMLPVDNERLLKTLVMDFDTIHDDGSGNADFYDIMCTV